MAHSCAQAAQPVAWTSIGVGAVCREVYLGGGVGGLAVVMLGRTVYVLFPTTRDMQATP